jgi:hypothetical protein
MCCATGAAVDYSGHVEITKPFVDRLLKHTSHCAHSGHRCLSSSGLHGIAQIFFEQLNRELRLEIECRRPSEFCGNPDNEALLLSGKIEKSKGTYGRIALSNNLTILSAALRPLWGFVPVTRRPEVTE